MVPTAKSILAHDFQMPIKLKHLYSPTMMEYMKENLDTISFLKGSGDRRMR